MVGSLVTPERSSVNSLPLVADNQQHSINLLTEGLEQNNYSIGTNNLSLVFDSQQNIDIEVKTVY